MLDRNARLLVVIAGVVVVVVGYLVLRPGGDGQRSSSTTTASKTALSRAPAATSEARAGEPRSGTAAPRPAGRSLAAPRRFLLTLRDHAVVAGPRRIEVSKGDQVLIEVRSDQPEKLHLHGFDLERDAAPGKPAVFRFEASIEGSFELETHTSDQRVARVEVRPR